MELLIDRDLYEIFIFKLFINVDVFIYLAYSSLIFLFLWNGLAFMCKFTFIYND
jgi:hypothetical protein